MCNCGGSQGDHQHQDGCGCIQGRGMRFTEPALLLMLLDGPSHGYDLAIQLSGIKFPGEPPDPPTVYRNLRQMEESGLVKSRWETSEAGPAKRLYELTAEGEEMLHAWAVNIRARRDALDTFLRSYSDRFPGKEQAPIERR